MRVHELFKESYFLLVLFKQNCFYSVLEFRRAKYSLTYYGMQKVCRKTSVKCKKCMDLSICIYLFTPPFALWLQSYFKTLCQSNSSVLVSPFSLQFSLNLVLQNCSQ